MPDEMVLECLLVFVPKSYEDRMLELNVSTTAQAFEYINWKLSQLNRDRLADIEEREISKTMARRSRADYACGIRDPSPSQERGRDRQRRERGGERTRSPRSPSRSASPPASAVSSPGTMPERDFKGCWWCGIKGHSKYECKKLIALRERTMRKFHEM